ncbi:MAG: polyprenyl synthetase family protein [Planctomycetaceae bacterium]
MQHVIEERSILSRVESLIGPALLAAERTFDRELASANPYLADILSHTRRFRGKRLRPLLLLLSAEATGGIRDEHVTLAAVIEMIHTATLVHDDVLDDADLRRHVATVNSRWNNSTSVLFGDYLFTHAFHLAASVGTTDACRMIGRATNIVCEGELTQVRQGGNLDLTEEEYLKIIEAKTGELCAVACRLGARFSNAGEAVASAMDRYGRQLGIAFQIADDVLDLAGTERETGKTLGSDLAQRKLTLPLIRLLSSTANGTATHARELIASGDASTAAELHRLLVSSGALASARQTALEYAEGARSGLRLLPNSDGRQLLEEVAEFAVRREF